MDVKNNGAFLQSLNRNNSQIKGARAEAVYEDAELMYKRKVENLEIELKRLKREQENRLDMSPDNALSLKLAKNFDADEFVNTDAKLSIEIRNKEIELELARKRYDYLFLDNGENVEGEVE